MINGSHCINLDEVKSMTYEYNNDVAIGIDNLDDSEELSFSVYRLDGRFVMSGNFFFQKSIVSLPKGIYIIKANGRTYKIVR